MKHATACNTPGTSLTIELREPSFSQPPRSWRRPRWSAGCNSGRRKFGFEKAMHHQAMSFANGEDRACKGAV